MIFYSIENTHLLDIKNQLRLNNIYINLDSNTFLKIFPNKQTKIKELCALSLLCN